MSIHAPEPVQVLELFPEERAALLALLAGLEPEEWEKATACAGWSVKDVASHILGGDLTNISRRRDDFRGTNPRKGETLVELVNRINYEWVEVARRLSPGVITDLLKVSGAPLFDYFGTLDLSEKKGAVSWAGPDPAAVWLDVAREYTERWLHQQHIRDAVGKPGLMDRRFMAPVLAAFVFALPPAFREIKAPGGTAVHLHIRGEAGGDWALVREPPAWTLYSGEPDKPDAIVGMDQSVAWRLFTKGLRQEEAIGSVLIEGDRPLGEQVLNAVAIIA